MVKLGRVQCAILDQLPATFDEIEYALAPSSNQVVYTALMLLYANQITDMDNTTQMVTARDLSIVRDMKAWRLPAPLPPVKTKRRHLAKFQKRLIQSLAKRGGRTPRLCGDLWAIGIVNTRRRLLFMERGGWIDREDDGRLIVLSKKGHALCQHWAGNGATKKRRLK